MLDFFCFLLKLSFAISGVGESFVVLHPLGLWTQMTGFFGKISRLDDVCFVKLYGSNVLCKGFAAITVVDFPVFVAVVFVVASGNVTIASAAAVVL